MTHDRHVFHAPEVPLQTGLPMPPAAEQDVVAVVPKDAAVSNGLAEGPIESLEGEILRPSSLFRDLCIGLKLPKRPEIIEGSVINDEAEVKGGTKAVPAIGYEPR